MSRWIDGPILDAQDSFVWFCGGLPWFGEGRVERLKETLKAKGKTVGLL
jgi:hypothetical protein